MIYTVEIDAIITIEADSKDDAIRKVKQQFEDENLTYENLYFTCDEGYEE